MLFGGLKIIPVSKVHEVLKVALAESLLPLSPEDVEIAGNLVKDQTDSDFEAPVRH